MILLAARARARALRVDVVVARGGVIQGDHGRSIDGERPQVEDAAADTLPGGASRPRGAAVRLVERDQAADEREVRRAEGRGAAVEDAAALAVAAVATRRAVAAFGQVPHERGVRQDGRDAERREEPAALASSAVAANAAATGRAPGPADRLVAGQESVADVDRAENARTAPPWPVPPSPPLPPSPPAPPVALLSTITTSLRLDNGVEVPKVTV